ITGAATGIVVNKMQTGDWFGKDWYLYAAGGAAAGVGLRGAMNYWGAATRAGLTNPANNPLKLNAIPPGFASNARGIFQGFYNAQVACLSSSLFSIAGLKQREAELLSSLTAGSILGATGGLGLTEGLSWYQGAISGGLTSVTSTYVARFVNEDLGLKSPALSMFIGSLAGLAVNTAVNGAFYSYNGNQSLNMGNASKIEIGGEKLIGQDKWVSANLSNYADYVWTNSKNSLISGLVGNGVAEIITRNPGLLGLSDQDLQTLPYATAIGAGVQGMFNPKLSTSQSIANGLLNGFLTLGEAKIEAEILKRNSSMTPIMAAFLADAGTAALRGFAESFISLGTRDIRGQEIPDQTLTPLSTSGSVFGSVTNALSTDSLRVLSFGYIGRDTSAFGEIGYMQSLTSTFAPRTPELLRQEMEKNSLRGSIIGDGSKVNLTLSDGTVTTLNLMDLMGTSDSITPFMSNSPRSGLKYGDASGNTWISNGNDTYSLYNQNSSDQSNSFIAGWGQLAHDYYQQGAVNNMRGTVAAVVPTSARQFLGLPISFMTNYIDREGNNQIGRLTLASVLNTNTKEGRTATNTLETLNIENIWGNQVFNQVSVYANSTGFGVDGKPLSNSVIIYNSFANGNAGPTIWKENLRIVYGKDNQPTIVSDRSDGTKITEYGLALSTFSNNKIGDFKYDPQALEKYGVPVNSGDGILYLPVEPVLGSQMPVIGTVLTSDLSSLGVVTGVSFIDSKTISVAEADRLIRFENSDGSTRTVEPSVTSEEFAARYSQIKLDVTTGNSPATYQGAWDAQFGGMSLVDYKVGDIVGVPRSYGTQGRVEASVVAANDSGKTTVTGVAYHSDNKFFNNIGVNGEEYTKDNLAKKNLGNQETMQSSGNASSYYGVTLIKNGEDRFFDLTKTNANVGISENGLVSSVGDTFYMNQPSDYLKDYSSGAEWSLGDNEYAEAVMMQDGILMRKGEFASTQNFNYHGIDIKGEVNNSGLIGFETDGATETSVKNSLFAIGNVSGETKNINISGFVSSQGNIITRAISEINGGYFKFSANDGELLGIDESGFKDKTGLLIPDAGKDKVITSPDSRYGESDLKASIIGFNAPEGLSSSALLGIFDGSLGVTISGDSALVALNAGNGESLKTPYNDTTLNLVSSYISYTKDGFSLLMPQSSKEFQHSFLNPQDQFTAKLNLLPSDNVTLANPAEEKLTVESAVNVVSGTHDLIIVPDQNRDGSYMVDENATAAIAYGPNAQWYIPAYVDQKTKDVNILAYSLGGIEKTNALVTSIRKEFNGNTTLSFILSKGYDSQVTFQDSGIDNAMMLSRTHFNMPEYREFSVADLPEAERQRIISDNPRLGNLNARVGYLISTHSQLLDWDSKKGGWDVADGTYTYNSGLGLTSSNFGIKVYTKTSDGERSFIAPLALQSNKATQGNQPLVHYGYNDLPFIPTGLQYITTASGVALALAGNKNTEKLKQAQQITLNHEDEKYQEYKVTSVKDGLVSIEGPTLVTLGRGEDGRFNFGIIEQAANLTYANVAARNNISTQNKDNEASEKNTPAWGLSRDIAGRLTISYLGADNGDKFTFRENGRVENGAMILHTYFSKPEELPKAYSRGGHWVQTVVDELVNYQINNKEGKWIVPDELVNFENGLFNIRQRVNNGNWDTKGVVAQELIKNVDGKGGIAPGYLVRGLSFVKPGDEKVKVGEKGKSTQGKDSLPTLGSSLDQLKHSVYSNKGGILTAGEDSLMPVIMGIDDKGIFNYSAISMAKGLSYRYQGGNIYLTDGRKMIPETGYTATVKDGKITNNIAAGSKFRGNPTGDEYLYTGKRFMKDTGKRFMKGDKAYSKDGYIGVRQENGSVYWFSKDGKLYSISSPAGNRLYDNKNIIDIRKEEWNNLKASFSKGSFEKQAGTIGLTEETYIKGELTKPQDAYLKQVQKVKEEQTKEQLRNISKQSGIDNINPDKVKGGLKEALENYKKLEVEGKFKVSAAGAAFEAGSLGKWLEQKGEKLIEGSGLQNNSTRHKGLDSIAEGVVNILRASLITKLRGSVHYLLTFGDSSVLDEGNRRLDYGWGKIMAGLGSKQMVEDINLLAPAVAVGIPILLAANVAVNSVIWFNVGVWLNTYINFLKSTYENNYYAASGQTDKAKPVGEIIGDIADGAAMAGVSSVIFGKVLDGIGALSSVFKIVPSSATTYVGTKAANLVGKELGQEGAVALNLLVNKVVISEAITVGIPNAVSSATTGKTLGWDTNLLLVTSGLATPAAGKVFNPLIAEGSTLVKNASSQFLLKTGYAIGTQAPLWGQIDLTTATVGNLLGLNETGRAKALNFYEAFDIYSGGLAKGAAFGIFMTGAGALANRGIAAVNNIVKRSEGIGISFLRINSESNVVRYGGSFLLGATGVPLFSAGLKTMAGKGSILENIQGSFTSENMLTGGLIGLGIKGLPAATQSGINLARIEYGAITGAGIKLTHDLLGSYRSGNDYTFGQAVASVLGGAAIGMLAASYLGTTKNIFSPTSTRGYIAERDFSLQALYTNPAKLFNSSVRGALTWLYVSPSFTVGGAFWKGAFTNLEHAIDGKPLVPLFTIETKDSAGNIKYESLWSGQGQRELLSSFVYGPRSGVWMAPVIGILQTRASETPTAVQSKLLNIQRPFSAESKLFGELNLGKVVTPKAIEGLNHAYSLGIFMPGVVTGLKETVNYFGNTGKYSLASLSNLIDGNGLTPKDRAVFSTPESEFIQWAGFFRIPATSVQAKLSSAEAVSRLVDAQGRSLDAEGNIIPRTEAPLFNSRGDRIDSQAPKTEVSPVLFGANNKPIIPAGKQKVANWLGVSDNARSTSNNAPVVSEEPGTGIGPGAAWRGEDLSGNSRVDLSKYTIVRDSEGNETAFPKGMKLPAGVTPITKEGPITTARQAELAGLSAKGLRNVELATKSKEQLGNEAVGKILNFFDSPKGPKQVEMVREIIPEVLTGLNNSDNRMPIFVGFAETGQGKNSLLPLLFNSERLDGQLPGKGSFILVKNHAEAEQTLRDCLSTPKGNITNKDIAIVNLKDIKGVEEDTLKKPMLIVVNEDYQFFLGTSQRATWEKVLRDRLMIIPDSEDWVSMHVVEAGEGRRETDYKRQQVVEEYHNLLTKLFGGETKTENGEIYASRTQAFKNEGEMFEVRNDVALSPALIREVLNYANKKYTVEIKNRDELEMQPGGKEIIAAVYFDAEARLNHPGEHVGIDIEKKTVTPLAKTNSQKNDVHFNNEFQALTNALVGRARMLEKGYSGAKVGSKEDWLKKVMVQGRGANITMLEEIFRFKEAGGLGVVILTGA
ncbi:MAG: hypothetical protein COT38_01180, partial [Candidatus Omnitrophica bacterium CG08_land_8_20_14_0_20_41_16]